jgi:hypothetical protein
LSQRRNRKRFKHIITILTGNKIIAKIKGISSSENGTKRLKNESLVAMGG